MRAGRWFALGVIVSLLLVAVLVVGGVVWERWIWHVPALAAPLAPDTEPACGLAGYQMGPGMMRGRFSDTSAECNARPPDTGAGCGLSSDNADGVLSCTAFGGQVPDDGSTPLSLDAAYEAVQAYLERSGYANLVIDELMEFEWNFYAIVGEPESGIGAMELLVNKYTGVVGPEMGPNMMWNARYGMHGRGGMMGRNSETNALSEEEVLDKAQAWLDEYRPGTVTEEHADPFYGYYTIHTLKDGEIEGMLSVHGTTGQIWYHTWHGSFVQMREY